MQQSFNKISKIDDTFIFKQKGKILQSEFNKQILQIVQNMSSAVNNEMPANSKDNDFCNDLEAKLKRINNLVNMTDRSLVGWETVAE